MDTNQLRDHVKATYRALRRGAAVLGFALPWVLWIGGRLAGLPLQGSMSAYYHTVMRDEFVGVLFAISALLALYKGYTQLENWVLNFGGLFLAGVALFPMDASCGDACSGFSLHGTLAVLFFVAIAYVCVFRASDTLGLMKDAARAARFKKTYRWLGLGMLVSPLGAVVLAFVLQPGSQARSVIFFVETAGVYVFATYWLVKDREIALTDSETLAIQGKLVTTPPTAKHIFRELPVEEMPGPGGPRTGPASP